MGYMNENKNKGIPPRFTNRLNNFIKSIDTSPNESAYSDILKKMLNDPSMINFGFHQYKDKSAYANNTVDDDGGYTSFRVSDHFPIMANIIDRVPEGYPTKKKYGHICIFLFGHYELLKVKRSASGQYALNRDNSKIIVDEQQVFERIKNFYSDGSTFPYRLYHYIPNLMTFPNDVDSIIKESVEWFNGGGTKEFNYIELSDPNSRPSKECMYAEVRFVINRGKMNENISNIIVSSGKEPVLSFITDRRQYVFGDDSFTVDVYIDIYDCAAYMLEYMTSVAEQCNRIFDKRTSAAKRKR